MNPKDSLSKMDSMQRFTATGRPFKSADPTKEGWSMNSMAVADSYGAAQGNLLPAKYTDDSLIPVPVLKPDQAGKALPERKRSFFSRRKSKDDSFTIKHLPRGEYLKHYAKDDNGTYVGTEEPAAGLHPTWGPISPSTAEQPLLSTTKSATLESLDMTK